MPVPNSFRDGDMTIATQDGPGWWSLPFEPVGDTQSFEYHANFTQLAANYTPLKNYLNFIPSFTQTAEQMQSIATPRGIAYLVEEGETQDIGCGVLKFKRTYASIPVNRVEGTTVSYSIQLPSVGASYTWTNPPPAPEVGEFPIACAGWYKYEYFNATYPPVIYAPRVTSVFNTLLYVNWPPDYKTEFTRAVSLNGKPFTRSFRFRQPNGASQTSKQG